MKITKLPYLGKHVEPKAIKAKRLDTKEITMGALHEFELRQVEESTGDLSDPYLVLVRKVTHLANLLGCSEDEAERVLLNRIGA